MYRIKEELGAEKTASKREKNKWRQRLFQLPQEKLGGLSSKESIWIEVFQSLPKIKIKVNLQPKASNKQKILKRQ